MSSLELTSLYICILFLSFTVVVHSTYVLNPENKGYLKVHKEVATWDEAKTHCENEGAILASPVNAQLLKYMKSVITTNNHTTPYFIGINATLGEATSFVSQEGYKLNPITGSYYKFYDDTHAASWKEDNNVCVMDGGHLAVLNSHSEARVVKNIAFPLGLYDYAFIYIGFRDWSGNNYWISNTGDVAENFFSVFESKKQSGSCGILKHTGQLEGYTCNDKLPFVCEKQMLGPCLVID